MVLAGRDLGAGALAADLASLLAERDILGRDQEADIALRLEALRSERAVVNRGAKERIREASRQIRRIARISGGDSASAGVLVGLAFPDRLARARGGHGRFLMAGGGGAILDSHDSLAASPFLAIASTDGRAGDQKVFLAAEISADEIEQHFASAITVEEWLAWDVRQKQVIASRRRKLGAIILDERPLDGADPDRIAAAMCDGVAAMSLASLPWSEGALRLRQRTDFLRRLFPGAGWPDLADEALLASLESWLKPHLAGMTRAQHLTRLDMHRIMQDQIPPALRHELDRLAPSRLVIPSGREVTIDYGEGDDPVLRARLQEMFGLAETPRVAGGRVPLRVELLSPAGRPLAVTQSLETFWTNVYPSVRAEMRGRYPKHAWPDDPRSVPALKPRQLR
jgi:ATP-dependent helicase HrpB